MEQQTIILPLTKGTSFSEVEKHLILKGIKPGLSLESNFSSVIGETIILYGDKNILVLLGLGDTEVVGKSKKTVLSCLAKNRKQLTSNIALDPSLINGEDLFIIEQLACGMVLGAEDIGMYKSEKKDEDYSFSILSENQKTINAFNTGMVKGETVASIIKLVNAPSNYKSPQEMAEWLKTSSEKYNYNLNILEKENLEQLGFHALLAVNRGSEVPAKCLIATYGEKKEGVSSVTIVGKGVTFDTGGLSIKGSNNMHYMKSDMGGAAAAMGTIEVVARLKLNVHLRVIVPTTDNSVDANSIKPGDVISSYSGKTIEVIDTDAEGRLILADGLSYAVKNDNPDYLIDLATLTGSIVRSLGTEAAGLMSHNDDLVSQIVTAGNKTGEKLWRMPLWEEYGQHMKSDIADIKNLSAKPMAGAITAAKFLEAFVDKHPAWAHMDIAGTAFGAYPTSKAYSGTGYGIDLLTQWLRSIS
ncbi:MAG: leucyl aminopeptidase family protein [Saprospiraceae bacterium]|nr:leucyl aminopeptidase family protein [Saprospiraceae bacterium]